MSPSLARSAQRRILVVLGLLAAMTLATAGSLSLKPVPTSAAFPGVNGTIAFIGFRDGAAEVYVMNADGSGRTNLTNSAQLQCCPAWSADGLQIAFGRLFLPANSEIYVMNADGSGQTNLSNNSAFDIWPAWSPDGSKIAFQSDRDGNEEVYVMNANGSGQANLTVDPAQDSHPAWSPDGSQIAFTRGALAGGEVYVMEADGAGQTNLTNDPAHDWQPDWQALVAPDLVVEEISDAQNPFIDCTTPAGVKVVVRNIGTGPAGASNTSVSVGAQYQNLSTPALAAGEAVTLFSTVAGIPFSDTYVATADSNDAIAESDETNNSRIETLALGTLPTCTATPAPTPTITPTPTSNRPPPIPEIDKTVNGDQGPITVTQGDSVTYRWVVTNAGDRAFTASILDNTHDALDGGCLFVNAGQTCEQSAVVVLLTPGPITDTALVVACAIPPWPAHCQEGHDSDSVTVFVVTPTPAPPTPIGGIGIFPAVPGNGADGGSAATWAAAGAVAGALALGGGAWYARRRRTG